MRQRSEVFSRPAEWAGRARSGPCSGSWCWWRPRVSAAGEDAADSCGGSVNHTSHTEKQEVHRLQIKQQWHDMIFCVLRAVCLLYISRRDSVCFRTHSVRLLSSVNAQMALQGLQVAEAGATCVAGVRFLPRMDQNMGPQMGNLTPGPTTQTGWQVWQDLNLKKLSA